MPDDLDVASSYGRVQLTVPTFGDAFEMEIFKNEGQGEIKMPFECTSKETKKFDKNDTYRTDMCTVKRGEGGPRLKLLTGTGSIEIDTTAN